MSPTIRKDCPCPKTTCTRFTLCDECEAFREAKGMVPFCKEPPLTLREKIRKMLRPKK